jgi:pre-mRNA-splicing helicase BRR2
LHGDRGLALEAVISRTIHRMEHTRNHIQLAAVFPPPCPTTKMLRHSSAWALSRDLFYFDASYCPCALQQQFVGVTEKKAIKRYQVMVHCLVHNFLKLMYVNCID